MDRETRAKRIADLHVFYGQNEVVEELIRAGKIDEEYMYPFVDTDGGNMCPIQCLPTAGTVFLHFAQKTLAIGNVIGYTHRIPTATAHSTSCAAAAKEKENEPLWLAVRQCGDLS